MRTAEQQGAGKPRTNIVSRVSHARAVVVLEDSSANDDFTEAERVEIDRQFEITKQRDCREFVVDRAREEAAARVEAAQRRAQGLPW